MILLEEATTEQIIKELHDRSEYLALLVNIPSNGGEYYTCWKGSFIEKIGMAHALKSQVEAKSFHNNFKIFNSQDEGEAL